MIELRVDGCPTEVVRSFRFSGGEVQVRLQERPPAPRVALKAVIKTSDDFMELLLTVDAIRRQHEDTGIDLICPYLPYARQDRVCHPGEANSLKIACRLLDLCDFTSIETWDVHNPVAIRFNTTWTNLMPVDFVRRINFARAPMVVAPDHGAIPRASAVAFQGAMPFVAAEKVRDSDTGQITGMKIDCDPIGSRDFLMVDDICDGGRTFVELAKLLRPLTTGRILLYVTHGIFSQGFDVFDGLIDCIYTPNPFPAQLPATVIKI